jgi:hypothetical protein
MAHPVLARLSAVQLGWLTFWGVTIGLALTSERLRSTENLFVIGGVLLVAGLAAASVYLVSTGALRRCGSPVNWTAFLVISLLNVVITTSLAALMLGVGGEEPPPDTVGAAPDPTDIPPQLPAFPWPPPRASSQAVINFGGAPGTLGSIDQDLSLVLENSGYTERSYFAVPGGFTLVTRLEQTERDGRPKEGDERWAITVGPLREFSLSSYLEALFTANPGYYRVLAFIVTATPFSQSDSTISRDEAMRWLTSGFNMLPADVAAQPLTPAHRTTVLVYEFEQQQASTDRAQLAVPGRLTARAHLERTSLWKELGQ